MKKIFILGATGSIGISTLEVAKSLPNKIKVVGLSAHTNDKKLSELGINFDVEDLIITGKKNSTEANINSFGYDSLIKSIKSSSANIVVNGIAGSSGLLPSIATLESKKDLALANKETMVMAGSIVNKLAKQNSVRILPVDSEHSAIFHLTQDSKPEDVSEIILTASGGAFINKTYLELKDVTLEDALKHPTWNMGQKITIDSASMANKGLEVIEAAMLFNIPRESIKVLIHPQSYVHSLIRKKDGSMYAQISAPNMKLPIQNAILYPELENVLSSYLDLTDKNLTFSKPDFKKYEMLELSYLALELGEAYCIAYNAANEILVEAFMKKEISFLDIPLITRRVLSKTISILPTTIDKVLEIDNEIRNITKKMVGNLIDN